MPNYEHGVYGSEAATSIQSPVVADSATTFCVGTAPVNMTDPANVNKIAVAYTRGEAVAAMGFVAAKANATTKQKEFEYTLSEMIDSHFKLFGAAPLIMVNVLDPTKHKKAAETSTVTLATNTGAAVIAETGILPESVTLGDGLTKGTDYVVMFDDDGNLTITSIKGTDGNFLCPVGEALNFSAEKLDPSAVTVEDIIGGVDTDGKNSGLELIEEVFPRFCMVPAQVLAPGFSGNPTCAAVMAAKTASINGHFKAISAHDIPTDTVKNYQSAAEWKNTNNLVDPSQICCYPMVNLDGTTYHMSTQLAGLIAKVDAANDNVPYVSPSNKNFEMTSTVLKDGTEIAIPINGANSALNGNGIVTAINFIGGWKCWGNRTACYPANTDVKDNFIAVRRMFNWINNTLILSYWSKVDDPLNRRLIDTQVESANQWLNSLAAAGQIYGGRVAFLEDENPTINLIDGKMKFHLYIGAEVPARKIEYVQEYDASYFNTLFS